MALRSTAALEDRKPPPFLFPPPRAAVASAASGDVVEEVEQGGCDGHEPSRGSPEVRGGPQEAQDAAARSAAKGPVKQT